MSEKKTFDVRSAAQMAFANVIDKRAPGTWESNPWVWALTFDVVKGGTL